MHQPTVSRLIAAVAGVVEQQEIQRDPAQLAHRTFDELGLDSVAILSVLVAVEDEFNIEFSDDTPSEALRSVTHLAEYLEHAYLT